jgi:uncharacterized integral membrane protein
VYWLFDTQVIVLRRYLSLIILVPLAVLLVAFAVANRQSVQLSFDPMNVSDPAFAVQLPMFVLVFAAMAVGLVLGGIATWFSQGKHRKLARQKNKEAAKWQFEVEKQTEKNKVERFSTATGSSRSFPVLPPSKAA